MFNPDEYPIDYDFLSKEQKDNILKYMNALKGKYWRNILTMRNSGVRELEARSNQYLENYRKRVDAARGALQAAGIYVEFGWRGHGNEWFLATYADALLREDDFFEVNG